MNLDQQQENQSHYKNTIYIANLDSNVGIKDIYELFGLKSKAHLHKNSYLGFPLNQQIQSTKGHVYITAPKHVFDELVKLNAKEFKGKYLFIEDANIRPKVANPNTTIFTSPGRFYPLRFTNSSPALGNNIDNIEERDLHVDFKRTVRNSLESSKYILKQKIWVLVNT